MSQDTIKPNDNSIDFEPTTIEDAAKTESPAEHAARMDEFAGKFDLPQELLKPESSWQNITNTDGDLVGTTADGTKVVFASDHGDLIIRHPDGRSENRTVTVDEVEKMFGITMSKMKNVNEIALQRDEEKRKEKELLNADLLARRKQQEDSWETYKVCRQCSRKLPADYNYCSTCRAEVSSQPIISKNETVPLVENEVKENKKESSEANHENQKKCSSCGNWNPSDWPYCGKCREPFPSESIVKETGETKGEESEKTRKSFEEFESERYLERSKQLEVVTTFDELYKVLRSFKRDLKGIYEDSDFYLFHRQIIEESRKSVIVRDGLPEKYGIRKKVFELCAKEDANKIAENSNFSVPVTKIESVTNALRDSVEELDSSMENTKKVEGVNSFEELFTIMDSFGEFIPRSNGQKVWTVNVKNAINKYRDGSVPIDVKDILDNLGNPSNALKGVTSTFGLRKKAYELIRKEGSLVFLMQDGSLKKGL